ENVSAASRQPPEPVDGAALEETRQQEEPWSIELAQGDAAEPAAEPKVEPWTPEALSWPAEAQPVQGTEPEAEPWVELRPLEVPWPAGAHPVAAEEAAPETIDLP